MAHYGSPPGRHRTHARVALKRLLRVNRRFNKSLKAGHCTIALDTLFSAQALATRAWTERLGIDEGGAFERQAARPPPTRRGMSPIVYKMRTRFLKACSLKRKGR